MLGEEGGGMLGEEGGGGRYVRGGGGCLLLYNFTTLCCFYFLSSFIDENKC